MTFQDSTQEETFRVWARKKVRRARVVLGRTDRANGREMPTGLVEAINFLKCFNPIHQRAPPPHRIETKVFFSRFHGTI